MDMKARAKSICSTISRNSCNKSNMVLTDSSLSSSSLYFTSVTISVFHISICCVTLYNIVFIRSFSLMIPSFMTISKNALSSALIGAMSPLDGWVPSLYFNDHCNNPSHANGSADPDMISSTFLFYGLFIIFHITGRTCCSYGVVFCAKRDFFEGRV